MITFDYSPLMIAALIGIGFFVGFVNTLAGMATAISYAVFMAMGMPINVANGTTRVGVLAQFAVSSFIFKKRGYLEMKTGVNVGIPVAIGSLIGAELVAVLDPHIIETVMGILLPILAVVMLTNITPSIMSLNKTGERLTPVKFVIFTIIGVYGGFTHAGVGILIIFGTVFFYGMDMLKSNAVKQFAVLCYTPVALMVFIWHGQVNWPIALIYAVGNIGGAVLASRVAIKWGVKFIKLCVAIAVISISFWLIFKQFQ